MSMMSGEGLPRCSEKDVLRPLDGLVREDDKSKAGEIFWRLRDGEAVTFEEMLRAIDGDFCVQNSSAVANVAVELAKRYPDVAEANLERWRREGKLWVTNVQAALVSVRTRAVCAGKSRVVGRGF